MISRSLIKIFLIALLFFVGVLGVEAAGTTPGLTHNNDELVWYYFDTTTNKFLARGASGVTYSFSNTIFFKTASPQFEVGFDPNEKYILGKYLIDAYPVSVPGWIDQKYEGIGFVTVNGAKQVKAVPVGSGEEIVDAIIEESGNQYFEASILSGNRITRRTPGPEYFVPPNAPNDGGSIISGGSGTLVDDPSQEIDNITGSNSTDLLGGSGETDPIAGINTTDSLAGNNSTDSLGGGNTTDSLGGTGATDSLGGSNSTDVLGNAGGNTGGLPNGDTGNGPGGLPEGDRGTFPEGDSDGPVGLRNPLKVATFSGLLNLIFRNIILPLGTSVIVLFIIYSGFLFVVAQGNEEKLKKAKATFMWTVIGAAVLLGSSVIANVILNTIEQLR